MYFFDFEGVSTQGRIRVWSGWCFFSLNGIQEEKPPWWEEQSSVLYVLRCCETTKYSRHMAEHVRWQFA